MATKHKRATMTARQLAEDYLAHQITRDVTRASTRHHLNQLLALFGGRAIAHGVRYAIVILFAGILWPMTFRWFAARKPLHKKED